MRSFALALLSAAGALAQVKTTECNGQKYVYNELAGYGIVPASAVDRFYDTLGGWGSSAAIQLDTWRKTAKGYTGILWAIPDRGWNTEGTLNYQSRVHKFNLTLTNALGATKMNRSPHNINLQYLTSIALTDPRGTPTTGIDCKPKGEAMYDGFPPLPVANYTGNGFGGKGPGGRRVCIDAEGLVLGSDGSFWISDEYGPYIYHFNSRGRMIAAIEPPDAFIPIRHGHPSFSADSPAIYQDEDDDVSPPDPVSGRDNNHGLEGLTASPDGEYLYALLQAATVQDGGLSSSTERYTRMLQYSIAASPPKLVAEYVVPLPLYVNNENKTKAAAASEIHYISPTQFFVLARDSGAGHGQDYSLSKYRHADVVDISAATNVNKAQYNSYNGSVASSDGVLKAGITPAQYCSFLPYNDNDQLKRFNAHNGPPQNADLLNEKWESLAVVPQNPENGGSDGQFILFSVSDNDFITQNGRMNHGRFHYADSSGFDLDNQVLAFNISISPSS